MANNLLSQENVAFVSLHCGGDVYETASKPVGLKQQSIVFGSDITIPVVDEHIVTKIGLNIDSRPLEEPQCFLPISIRLNRRGLIDSEVVAVGKLLVPQSPDASVSPSSNGGVVSYSVPLINSEDNLEIAIVHIKVNSSRSQSSNVGRVLSEMQLLFAQYTKSKEETVILTDSIERFLGCVTPVRKFCLLLVSALTWEPSWAKSWLFLATVWIHPFGLPLYLLIIALIATNSPLPVLGYLNVHFYDTRGIRNTEDTIAENLLFLSDLVNGLASLAQMVNRERFKAEFIVAGVLFIFLFPISWAITGYMACQTMLVQAAITVATTPRRKASIMPATNLSDTGEYVVYENQRWWLGKWSERLINGEAQPWTTAIGPSVGAPEFTPKESFILPTSEDPVYQWKWNGPWSIDTTEGDGWLYGQDFRESKMHHVKRELTDFVRQRRWTRKFTRVKK